VNLAHVGVSREASKLIRRIKRRVQASYTRIVGISTIYGSETIYEPRPRHAILSPKWDEVRDNGQVCINYHFIINRADILRSRC